MRGYQIREVRYLLRNSNRSLNTAEISHGLVYQYSIVDAILTRLIEFDEVWPCYLRSDAFMIR